MSKLKIGDVVTCYGGKYTIFSIRDSLITLRGINKRVGSIVVCYGSVIKINPMIYAIRK